MKMGVSNYNIDLDRLGASFEPTAFELKMMKTEAQMQKMLSSPLIESLNKHEELVNSIISSPALNVMHNQQNILGNLPTVTNAISTDLQLPRLACLPSRSAIESVAYALRDIPTYALTENMGRAIESCMSRYNGLAETMAGAIDTVRPQISQIDGAIRSLADFVAMIDPAITAVAKQALHAMYGIADYFQRYMSAINNALRNIDRSPLLDSLSYMADVEGKNEVLKSFGWYLITELPEEIVDEIYERRAEITQEQVDALIVQYFRNDRCRELKNIVDNWKRLPYFEEREVVFHEAQVCHSRRSFNASTTLISLHFEGVITDFVRDRLGSPTYRVEKALKRINDLTDDLSLRDMPFEDWIICSYILECVDKSFTTNFSPADPDNCPNTSRHKIAHGHATEKETEAHSLRRFLFMNELYKLLCCLENVYQLAS
jgi:hypothetical protein